MRSDTGGFGPLGWAAVILGAIALLIVAVVGINFLTKFKAVDQAHVCVVRQGGPLDGRSISQVRQPGSGVSNIGLFNQQFCFPATQRNYIVSSNPNEGDAKTIDFVEVPTLDAVNVRVEGQALFQLNTDPAVVKLFYKKYGARTFDGKHPYDGDSGWANFLAQSFRPVLDNALREAIGDFRCVELNNLCQYVTNAEAAVKGNVKEVSNAQNIQQAQDKIQTILQTDLNDTLGGPFFQGIRFRLRGITFSPDVAAQITAAQTKRTEVATQQLEAQRQVAEAVGQRQVAEQQAKAIQVKARAYRNNPAQVKIEVAKALAGGNIQVLGGNALAALGGK